MRGIVEHSVRRSDRAAFGAYLEAWARTDFSDRVRADERVTRTPVRVVVGEHDRAITAAEVTDTWLAWHPDADLVVLGNAGHYATEETPVALLTAIEEFLAAHP